MIFGEEHDGTKKWGPNMIPETHPLQQLFMELVGRHYAHEIGIRDPQVVGYVAHLLAEFCDAEQMGKVRNASGRPLSDVGEMLLESDPVYGPAASFDREWQVRKHIGDFTLFFTGMFPESIHHYRMRRMRVHHASGIRTRAVNFQMHHPFARRIADETPHHRPSRANTAHHRGWAETWTVQHIRRREATDQHAFLMFPKPGVAGSIPAGGTIDHAGERGCLPRSPWFRCRLLLRSCCEGDSP